MTEPQVTKALKTPLDILRDTFGYNTFRSSQASIIEDVLALRDTLVIMPTGGGKSLCFQIPAMILPGLTVVVSPLIALMKDQVVALKGNGVPADYYNSSQSNAEKEAVLQRVRDHTINMLYLAPESLSTPVILKLLQSEGCSLFAIDEAHCISVWGNDFRPEYTKLAFLRRQYPDVPIMALTATADEATRADIVKQLGIEEARQYIESFERPNINIVVRPGLGRIEQIQLFLQHYRGQSGIIYCLSRKNAEKVAERLVIKGHKAAYYHAGMGADERHEVQRHLQNDDIDIICATIAFGMGIDKPDVRFVIHFNMPKNIEGFYQEIGRAGRDSEASESLLFYSWADMVRLRSFIEDSPANEIFKNIQLAKLDRIWEFANAPSCRTNLILNYFGEYKEGPCGHCDNCLHPPDSFDGTVLAQKALSAIARTNENIGFNLLIDVLRGSHRQEITKNNYHLIKTFGVGRDLPFVDWKHYITQMLNCGLISIDYTRNSKLCLTPLSEGVLRGEKEVKLVKYLKEQIRPKRQTKKSIVESELFNLLKQWRNEVAKDKNIPAYTILNDRTLHELAEIKPIALPGLIEISGIGAVKYEQYGAQVIQLIQEYIRTQEHVKNQKGKTYLQTLHLFKQGLDADEIAKMRDISPFTVLGHLSLLYEQGEDIPAEQICSVEELDKVQQKWNDLGQPEQMKTVYDAFQGQLEYYKIRFGITRAKKNQMDHKP